MGLVDTTVFVSLNHITMFSDNPIAGALVASALLGDNGKGKGKGRSIFGGGAFGELYKVEKKKDGNVLAAKVEKAVKN